MSELDDFFAEQERSQQKVLDDLKLFSPRQITGIVSASGPSGASFGAAKSWMFQLTLTHWRVDAGGVQSKQLSLLKSASERELKRLMDAFESYGVVSVVARIPDDLQANEVTGAYESLVSSDAIDEDLSRIVAKLKEPVTYVDPVLGAFDLDKRVGWFQGRTNWEGATVDLFLEAEDPGEVAKAAKVMVILRDRSAEWSRRIVQFAVDELLPLKNESWLDEGEVEFGQKEFMQRMKLELISVDSHDSFSFSFNDGDLFLGHVIVVSGTLANGPESAGIHG